MRFRWSGRPSSGFLRHLLHALPVLLGGLVITDFIESKGWLESLNARALDSFILSQPRRPIDDIAIVEITDDDYRTLFAGRSPLDRSKLHDLIAAIDAGGPRVIVVDLDTSEGWNYEQWAARVPSPCEPIIVWAQGADVAPVDPSRGVKVIPFQDARHTAAPCRSGVAVFPRDPDGVIRRYLRKVPTDLGTGAQGRADSLPWSAAALLGQSVPDGGADELVLNFAGDRYAFARYSSSAVIEQSATPGWAGNGPLRDRLVIVGGAFRAARDEYRTPLGPMTGADIVAHAIASEVHGGGIRGTNKAKEKLVELTVAVLIVFVGFRGYKRTALASEVILIPLVALAGSWFAFSTLGRWSSFAPYWVGMAIQQALTSLSPAAHKAAAAPLAVSGSSPASPSGPAPGAHTPRGHGSRRRRRRRG